MRLVCPNCDAEYEVDASAIPPSGRDVQCSNCGNAWFQPSVIVETALAEEAALFDAPQEDEIPAPPIEPAKARGLNETVVAVLRAEAEREAAARRAEAKQPIEMQTELGLAAGAATGSASPVAQRLAKMKGEDHETKPAPRPQTRREMLPAIEEINSTLRATSERRTTESATIPDGALAPRASSSGFRSGFLLVMVIAATAVLGYAMAPRISQQVPGLEPGLAGYVAAVDAARLWLDAVMQQAIAALRGLSKNSPA